MRFALGLLAFLALSSIAAAEPGSACARSRKAGKTCVLDLPAEEVTGHQASPGEAATKILVFATERSLIRVRHDLIPEIVKAAEDL